MKRINKALVLVAAFLVTAIITNAVTTLTNSSVTTTGNVNASGIAFLGPLNVTGNLTVDAILGHFGILNVTANTSFTAATNSTNATIRSLNVTDNASFEAQTVRFKDLNATNVTATAASIRNLNASTVNITGNLTTKTVTALEDSSLSGRTRHSQADAGAAVLGFNATFANSSTSSIWSCNQSVNITAFNITHFVLVNLTNGDGEPLTLYLPIVNATTCMS